MKLNYNIIWVDDKIETRPYSLMKKDLFDFITSEFFDCQIEEAEDFNEFTNLFKDNSSYDLIITDLSLNNGTTGKQVIDFVRDNKHNHTEIFFYSANTQLRQQELINSNRITFYQLTEGNYKELKDEIIDLVKLTISKFQHIVSMRGMIMSETSSLDLQMLDIINLALQSEKIDFNTLATKIYDDINALYETKTKFVNECKEKSKFKLLTKDNFVFSSDYKIRTLSEIVTSLNLNDFSEEYKEEIISIRNKFAHAILLKDEETKREYFKYGVEGITFDEELCKKIRLNIIKHKNNFNETFNKLNSK